MGHVYTRQKLGSQSSSYQTISSLAAFITLTQFTCLKYRTNKESYQEVTFWISTSFARLPRFSVHYTILCHSRSL